eukprot:CAMPEP_0197056180 /NCGR_PEP_ID=MMETSP1384-20130603/80247_1 /TAXON_ID=29189 /ORGANISM="Ammonia sp." /LENGTH=295 /DNA_ID=CAMNT_0042490061 /DNA_START=31 /DNA_END=918 /DNA_ORIENTATION=+
MALSSLEEKRAEALDDARSCGWQYLQFLETESIHKPRDVITIGTKLLKNNWVSSNNKWRLLERITICALEMDDKQLAADCIKELMTKFTKSSNRVRILRGMFYESKGEIKKAMDEYNFILDPKNDANHMMAHKRKIALLVAGRQTVEAIKLLCEYLKLYGSDREAWKQLFLLYTEMHNYELAKFCLEELITMNHNDYTVFQLYAEQLYNLGGSTNYTNALKYFSQALLISSDKNTRSLWGVIMCIRALRESSLSPSDKELIKNCTQKIMQNYADSKSALMDTVKNVLLTFNSSQD